MHKKILLPCLGMLTATLLFCLNGSSREKELSWKKDGSEMVLVPAGPFTMGSNKEPPEMPPHEVTLPAFYIDKYEVTNEKYLEFCKSTGHELPLNLSRGKVPQNLENHPVNNVTWEDARAYCEWTGRRLPTEAEWEKACRGTDAREFPWGNGWMENMSNSRKNSADSTKPVGSFPQGKSPAGAMDMAGNVWEWTSNWYKNHPGSKLHFDKTGKEKVAKGGAYFYSIFLHRCSARYPLDPRDATDHGGFRCAMDAP